MKFNQVNTIFGSIVIKVNILLKNRIILSSGIFLQILTVCLTVGW